jgi:chemotaxis signal transduction protein
MASSHFFPREDAQSSFSPSDPQADAAAQSPKIDVAAPFALGAESNLEFLTFSCDGIACAAPLGAIREALMSTPAIATLPDSPEWCLGVFQLRTEMLGVVDVRPLLFGRVIPDEATSAGDLYPSQTGHEPAIVVGMGVGSLALAVESIGDILAVRQHEILRDLVEHPAFGAIAPRYRLGLVAPDGYATRFALVALETLLADMLTALTDPEVALHA